MVMADEILIMVENYFVITNCNMRVLTENKGAVPTIILFCIHIVFAVLHCLPLPRCKILYKQPIIMFSIIYCFCIPGIQCSHPVAVLSKWGGGGGG